MTISRSEDTPQRRAKSQVPIVTAVDPYLPPPQDPAKAPRPVARPARPTGLPMVPQRYEVDPWGTRFVVVAVRGDLRVRVSPPMEKGDADAKAERLNAQYREQNQR